MSNRAEVIDILTRMSTNHFYGHREQEALKLGAEALKQWWIPVTERLPEYGEDVILSMNGDYGIGYLLPTYDEGRYEWYHSGWYYDFDEVDAWMPLPEPYRGGEEEIQSAERRGRWIAVENDIDYYPFMCSECHETVIKRTNYCPRCKAKMDEVEHAKKGE